MGSLRELWCFRLCCTEKRRDGHGCWRVSDHGPFSRAPCVWFQGREWCRLLARPESESEQERNSVVVAIRACSGQWPLWGRFRGGETKARRLWRTVELVVGCQHSDSPRSCC